MFTSKNKDKPCHCTADRSNLNLKVRGQKSKVDKTAELERTLYKSFLHIAPPPFQPHQRKSSHIPIDVNRERYLSHYSTTSLRSFLGIDVKTQYMNEIVSTIRQTTFYIRQNKIVIPDTYLIKSLHSFSLEL